MDAVYALNPDEQVEVDETLRLILCHRCADSIEDILRVLPFVKTYQVDRCEKLAMKMVLEMTGEEEVSVVPLDGGGLMWPGAYLSPTVQDDLLDYRHIWDEKWRNYLFWLHQLHEFYFLYRECQVNRKISIRALFEKYQGLKLLSNSHHCFSFSLYPSEYQPSGET